MKLIIRFSFIIYLLIIFSLGQYASASRQATSSMEADEAPCSIRTEAALMCALREAYTANTPDNPIALDAALHHIIKATTPSVLAATLEKVTTKQVHPDDYEMPEETYTNQLIMALKIIIKTALLLYLF